MCRVRRENVHLDQGYLFIKIALSLSGIAAIVVSIRVTGIDLNGLGSFLLRFGSEPRKSKRIVLLSPRDRHNPKPDAVAIEVAIGDDCRDFGVARRRAQG